MGCVQISNEVQQKLIPIQPYMVTLYGLVPDALLYGSLIKIFFSFFKEILFYIGNKSVQYEQRI